MKKITLLLILLSVSLGYSQVLVDFEGGAYSGNGNGTFTYSPEDGDCPGADTGVFSQEANPVATGNPSATAAEIITDTAGQPWQNAQLFLKAGDEIDLTGATKTISVLVYSDTATDILVKVVDGPGGVGTESATDASHTGNGWETLNFDFSVNLDGSQVATEIYARILFFPLWNEGGAAFGGGDYCGTQPLQSIWVDDITNTSTLGTKDFKIAGLSMYPNPTQDSWNIKTQKVEMTAITVFDVLGKSVLSMTPKSSEVTIEARSLRTGLYFAKIETANGSQTVKLIKK